MTKTGIFHISQQTFLIWSYEDNRLLQLEAVVI